MSALTRHQASGAYQRWEPPEFGKPATSEALVEEAATEDAELAPAEIEEDAAEPEPEFKLPTAEEVEQIYEEARKSGYDAGYEEGTARGRVEAMKLHGLVEHLDKALQGFEESVATQLLDLGIELARTLVRHELRSVPTTIVDVVREALLQVPQNHAMIHLHSEDAGLVKEYLGEQIAHVGHRLIEDDTVQRGGCRIESPGSELDATVETRWRRIMANLGREDEFESPAEERPVAPERSSDGDHGTDEGAEE